MGYIITAVGAGGKTTYLRDRAKKFLQGGKSVAITTSTHIWPPHEGAFFQNRVSKDEDDADCIDAWFGIGEEPDYYGYLEPSGKLSALSDEQITRLGEEYDVVLVEGDGSHCMPAKIPGKGEPVVPGCTDEIVVVMGAHAIGRRMDVVCQRFSQRLSGSAQDLISPSAIITEQMLGELAEKYYMLPLRERYPKAKIGYVLSQMTPSKDRIVGVLMASGFGRRYGSNKLIDLYEGKSLYRYAMDHVGDALGKENIVVVTQYEQIYNEVNSMGVDTIMNLQAQEGIAASIRLGTEWALKKGADAVIFFAADMPNLPCIEIRMYARQFLDSGKPFGCMVFGTDHTLTNPGAFRLSNGAEKLLALAGDRGAMRIMKQEPWNIYFYQILEKYCEDVDVKREV